MGLDKYSTTPALNDMATYFQTGMRPSAVKTAGWDVMADMAQLFNFKQVAGGTVNALTVAQPRPFASLPAGGGLWCIVWPSGINLGPATFAPDGLTAKNIYANGMALAGGELQPGVPAFLDYDGTQWNLLNPAPAGRNFMVDPCCRVAQGNTASLSTSRQYGAVDLVQCWAAGTVGAGTIQQAVGGTLGATGYTCNIGTVTLTGTGKVFFRRWIESRDAVALANKTALFSVATSNDLGAALSGSLTVNKANAQDSFAAVTQIASSAFTLQTGGGVVVASAAMGACGNGVEVILEFDCGAVTGKNFWTTDWQVCIGTVAQACAVPAWEEDYINAQRYYEKSYEYATRPGTITSSGSTGFPNSIGTANAGTIFDIAFRIQKVVSPTMTLYSPVTGASARIAAILVGDIPATTNQSTAQFGILNNSGANLTPNQFLQWQFTADSRL